MACRQSSHPRALSWITCLDDRGIVEILFLLVKREERETKGNCVGYHLFYN